MAKINYSTEQRNSLLSFLSENPDKMFSAKQVELALSGKEKKSAKAPFTEIWRSWNLKEKSKDVQNRVQENLSISFLIAIPAGHIFTFRAKNAEKFFISMKRPRKILLLLLKKIQDLK